MRAPVVVALGLVTIALAPSARAQDNELTLWYPRDPVQCLPSNITISGGQPPYYLRATPGALTSAAPLVDFGQITTAPPLELFWIVDLPFGTNFTLLLTSASGDTSTSPVLTVKYSSDTSCLNAPVSLFPIPEAAGGPSTSSSSPYPSGTTAPADNQSSTTSSPAGTSVPAQQSTAKKSGPGTGAIVGIAIGAIAIAILAACLVWFLLRRRRLRQTPRRPADLDGPASSPGGYVAVSTVPTPYTAPGVDDGSRGTTTVKTNGTNMASAYSYPVTASEQVRYAGGAGSSDAYADGSSTSMSGTALARNFSDSTSSSGGAVTSHRPLMPGHQEMSATTTTTLSSASPPGTATTSRSSKLSPPVQVPARTEYIQEEDAGTVPEPEPAPEVRREIVPPSYNEAWQKPEGRTG